MGTGTAVGDPTGGLPEWRFLTSDGLKFILAVVQTDTEGNPIGGSSAPTDTNLTEVGGAAIALGSALSAHSLPVVIASDQAAIPVKGSGAVGTDQSTGLFTIQDAVATTGNVTVTANATPVAGTLLAVSGLDTCVASAVATAFTGSVIITPQVSYDGGTTWLTTSMQEIDAGPGGGSTATATVTTVSHAWRFNITGATHVRVNSSSYSAGGTNPTVTLTAAPGQGATNTFATLYTPQGNLENASGNPTTGASRLTVATGVAATHSLVGTNSVAAGTSVDLGVAIANATIEWLPASYTVWPTIQLQGSLEGTNWFNMGGPITPTANVVGAMAVSNFPVRFLRANLTVAGTGGTIDAWVAGA